MQKIYCRKCGSEILRKNVLGIGYFDENIGKYKGRSFVAFKCPVCQKVRYQFLEKNIQNEQNNLDKHNLKIDRENKKLLQTQKIDIDQVITFYEKLKNINELDDLFELLESF